MTAAFAVLLVGHGLLHVIGVAKGFRLAPLPQLTQPITPLGGAVWLAAAVMMIGCAGAICPPTKCDTTCGGNGPPYAVAG